MMLLNQHRYQETLYLIELLIYMLGHYKWIYVHCVDLSILIGDIVLIPTALFRSHVELRS